MKLRPRVALAAALLAGSAFRPTPVTAAPATPPSAYFQFGDESAALSDGPGSLLFNPAAGLKYRNEVAISLIDRTDGKDWGRASLTRGPLTFAASGERDAAITPSLAIANGEDRLRFGVVTTWWPVSGGDRVRDFRAGVLSRPSPWFSIGFVADHLGQPRLGGVRFVREYTLGVGVRPLALIKSKANTWGPRFTLTADRWFDGGDTDAQFRYGAEVEVVPGLEIRGRYFDFDRSFQLGLSLLAPRSGYHAQSRHDRDGGSRYATHTLSFHKEQDRSVLVPPDTPRVPGARVGGD